MTALLERPPTAGLCLLSVEDEPETLDGPLDSLEYAGHRVERVETAETAAKRLSHHPYHLLILDQRLGSEDKMEFEGGAALVSQLKRGAYGDLNRDVPFVFVTGSEDWITEASKRLPGFRGIVLKGGAVSVELRDKIAQLVSQRRAQAQTAVTVVAEELGDVTAPLIEIRDDMLQLVATTAPGRQVELDPGLYLASAALPSGRQVQRAVKVTEGEQIVVVLESERGADTPRGPGNFTRAAGIRLLRGAAFEPGGGAVRVVRAERTDDELRAELLVDVQDDGIVTAQVAADGVTPWNVQLPAGRVTGAPLVCVLQVRVSSERIRVSAGPEPGTSAASVAAYLTAGLRQQAVAIARTAPMDAASVGDVLGAYAELRLSRDAILSAELAERLPHLPDAAVIAAEVARRRQDPDDAARWQDEALRRGVPIFSDGLSMLVAPLRSRASDPAAARLLELVPFVDFAELTVGYPAVDPADAAGSQHALADLGSPGWLAL